MASARPAASSRFQAASMGRSVYLTGLTGFVAVARR
jgi:hypothetical protein